MTEHLPQRGRADVARPILIHRQVSFSLAAFDHLKGWQRHLEVTERRHFTNSEVLSRLVLAHPAP